MKKLLYVSASPLAPAEISGANIADFDLLSHLAATRRFQVRALGTCDPDRLADLPGRLDRLGADARFALPPTRSDAARVDFEPRDGYPISLTTGDRFDDAFADCVDAFRPDLLFVHMSLRDRVSELTRASGARSVMHAHTVVQKIPLRSPLPPDIRILASSGFVQQAILEATGLRSDVLYPAVDLERYRCNAGPARAADRRFTVLLVNPVPVKGLFIFLDLVERFPQLEFVVVEGWAPLDAILKRHLDRRPNVRGVEQTWAMGPVYRRADLVLVPTQMDEAFGRVVVEAHAAGVPTLASRAGGLPEASGDAGLLVDDFRDAGVWQRKLEELIDDPGILQGKRALLSRNAQRFSAAKAARRFVEIVG